MEELLKFRETNWGWLTAPTALGIIAGALKLLAKNLAWVTDSKILTMLRGWLTHRYQTRASDELPPMNERGETPQ